MTQQTANQIEQLDVSGVTAFWTEAARHDAGLDEGADYALFGNGGAEEDLVMVGTPAEIEAYLRAEDDYETVEYAAVPAEQKDLYAQVYGGREKA